MKKREFLKLTGVVGAGVLIAPMVACNTAAPESTTPETTAPAGDIPVFELPPLGYAFNALEPAIDALTMEIHHGKHHGGYVKNLNAALEGQDRFGGKTLEQILGALTEDDTAIRNNGGGHYNHSLFWKVIAPGGANAPVGPLADAINASFGSFETFAEQFTAAAKTRFGSGWAWLIQTADGRLAVTSTPNQDNPLMTGLVEVTGTPILGLDVWEHAYYLNYQNRRPDYVSEFMKIINWDVVGANFAAH
ncbi:MAG: hypothetical protein RL226_1616 [Bacteroidota bacterium]|jgi:Fe-Mn family superoxide dismutase